MYTLPCSAVLSTVQQKFGPRVMREGDQQHLIRLPIPFCLCLCSCYTYVQTIQRAWSDHCQWMWREWMRSGICVLSPLCPLLCILFSFCVWIHLFYECFVTARRLPLFICHSPYAWLRSLFSTNRTAVNIYSILHIFEWYGIGFYFRFHAATIAFCGTSFAALYTARNSSRNNSKCTHRDQPNRRESMLYVLMVPYCCCF